MFFHFHFKRTLAAELTKRKTCSSKILSRMSSMEVDIKHLVQIKMLSAEDFFFYGGIKLKGFMYGIPSADTHF